MRAAQLQATVVCDMDIVKEGEASIQRARKGTGAKLCGGDEAMGVNVVKEPLGHGLLKELAEALQEGDGAVILAAV